VTAMKPAHSTTPWVDWAIARQHQHEGSRVQHHLTREQRDNVLAVLGAWWMMDGCSMFTHDAAVRIALRLARR
jgi:hypothetical protein